MNEVENEKYVYAKVLLYVFPHLRALEEATVQQVENKALLSYKKRDAFAEACEIADIVLFSHALGRLRGDLAAVLGGLNAEERYLVDYKYFHAEREEFPLAYAERSYYRKQKELLKKVCAALRERGWTKESFFSQLGGDPFLMRLYAAVRDGREREIVKKRAKKKLVFAQMKSSDSSRGTRGDFRVKKTNADTASAAHTARQISAI